MRNTSNAHRFYLGFSVLLLVGLAAAVWFSRDFVITIFKTSVPLNSAILAVIWGSIRLAIQNHPRIDYSEADRQEAEADWGIARSQYYPKIDWLTKIGPSGEMDTGKTEYGDSAVNLPLDTLNVPQGQ